MITVHVTPIGSLGWLEEQIEEQMNGGEGFINLLAFDIDGHKYTNCSSLRKEIDELSSNFATIDSSSRSWIDIKNFTKENTELLKLAKRFEDSHDTQFERDLEPGQWFEETKELHNNFGICASHGFRTKDNGVARLTSKIVIEHDHNIYPSPIHSAELKIASFKIPETTIPSYDGFFDDIRNPKANE